MREIPRKAPVRARKSALNAAERSPRAGERRSWCRRPLATVTRRQPRSCRRRACLHLRGSRDCETRARGITFFWSASRKHHLDRAWPAFCSCIFLVCRVSRIVATPRRTRRPRRAAQNCCRSTRRVLWATAWRSRRKHPLPLTRENAKSWAGGSLGSHVGSLFALKFRTRRSPGLPQGSSRARQKFLGCRLDLALPAPALVRTASSPKLINLPQNKYSKTERHQC